ncbi:sigma-70 family RNA polymerase sigma factor [Clostridium aestuarii]|uniref:Sigma-70 family RNA polymerase sigma factor n=1 Tax=Clostridium aestuarii TaxID=338193 RepID=A0ABT4D2E8_9CLOT|nr:sigma-70 family RNA polymerase sigma factor [Clostridium aestuarii]MCY6485414.1 sigma-70 family RNA polymerase sigma factor [Clostridium aestuarii]
MENIIKKAKKGDTQATAYIINKYKYLVLKKAGQYHIPGYEYEDLVQHGYLSIIKAIHMYKLGSNSYNGYFINTISTNFAALLKGTIKHLREIPNENIINNNKEYELTIEDQLIAYEEIKELYDAMDSLQPIEREILNRYYINNESFREIACDIEYSYNRITYLRTRAINKLRKIIKRK